MFDPNLMHSQKTFHTNIVANFLRFPTYSCMPQADNWSNGYGHPKTVDRHKVQSGKLEMDPVLDRK
jgi:hypothetical protein